MNELFSEFYLSIYLASVAAIGLLLILLAFMWLGRSYRTRRRRLEKKRNIAPVRTSSPVENPTKDIKDRGLASIEQHFTVTRLTLIPVILSFTAIAMLVPFLSLVPAAILSALVAALTVILGMAARPWVENIIAGLVLSFSRIVNIGDTIRMGDLYGTVEDITPTHTSIKLWDWRRYITPNSKMLQSNFITYTLYDPHVWTWIEFHVAYDSDVELVRSLSLEAALSSCHFANYEQPRFWVMEMNTTSFCCWVAAWANSPSDAWMLAHDIRTALVRSFRVHGISAHGYRHSLDERSWPINKPPPSDTSEKSDASQQS